MPKLFTGFLEVVAKTWSASRTTLAKNAHAEYVARAERIKATRGLTAITEDTGSGVKIDLLASEHVVGSILFNRNPLLGARVVSVKVSKPLQGQGIGRQLGIELALYELSRGSLGRFPSLLYTYDGFRHFGAYPESHYPYFLENKLPRAEEFAGEIKGVPWVSPEPKQLPPITQLRI